MITCRLSYTVAYSTLVRKNVFFCNSYMLYASQVASISIAITHNNNIADERVDEDRKAI